MINTQPLDHTPQNIQVKDIDELFSKDLTPTLLLMALAANSPETKKNAGIRSGERYLLKTTHMSAGTIPAAKCDNEGMKVVITV